MYLVFPGTRFTKQLDVLSPDPAKLQGHEIWCLNYCITLKFDRCLSSTTAETPVKFRSDLTTLDSHLLALTSIRSGGKTSYC